MDVSAAYGRLSGELDGVVVRDEAMARHTSYRIGGPAALFVRCASVGDLKTTFDVLASEQLPWTVVGRGSNLLVSDAGYPGAIVTLDGEFARQDYAACASDGGQGDPDAPVLVAVGAATPLAQVVQKAFGLGLSGLEFAVGIPGTLGGALAMNAGTGPSGIGDVVDGITTYVPGRGLRSHRGSSLEWGYRCGGVPAGEVVLEATLRLSRGDAESMRAAMEASHRRRKARQPLSLPSCGSVFRNPPGDSAARLIEACGLKGTTCGDAQISEKHANFIVNLGSATAADVLSLVHTARDRVKENYGVELRPEVRFIGFPR